MNREIKFMVWDARMGSFLMSDSTDSCDIYFKDDGTPAYFIEHRSKDEFHPLTGEYDGLHDETVFTDYDPNVHVMVQYTGYKDTNKYEAYEHDIIQAFDGDEVVGVGIITWCHGGWYVDGTGDRVNDSLFNVAYGGFKIIGNIYENPELAEGAK